MRMLLRFLREAWDWLDLERGRVGLVFGMGRSMGVLGRGDHGAGRISIPIGPIRGEQFSRARSYSWGPSAQVGSRTFRELGHASDDGWNWVCRSGNGRVFFEHRQRRDVPGRGSQEDREVEEGRVPDLSA